jgi:hypothetical protein
MAFLKFALIFFLLSISLFVQAGDMAPCNGSVLQRRLALVQFGRLVDAHIATKGALPDICSAPVKEILDGIPDLLKGALVCGSSKEGSVHYSCQIPSLKAGTPSEEVPVIESCRYSLVDQSVSCENRSVVTTFEGSSE